MAVSDEARELSVQMSDCMQAAVRLVSLVLGRSESQIIAAALYDYLTAPTWLSTAARRLSGPWAVEMTRWSADRRRSLDVERLQRLVEEVGGAMAGDGSHVVNATVAADCIAVVDTLVPHRHQSRSEAVRAAISRALLVYYDSAVVQDIVSCRPVLADRAARRAQAVTIRQRVRAAEEGV